MVNKRFAIIGSCVTRDAFELTKNEYKILFYHARSNIESLAQEKPQNEVYFNGIDGVSGFERKAIIADINKTHWTNLYKISEKNDYLVIDFIDDRFNTIKYKDNLITNSKCVLNFIKSEEIQNVDYHMYSSIQRAFKNISIFINKINTIISLNKIIINNVLWAKTDVSSEHLLFNMYLKSIYQYIKTEFPEIIFIDYKDNKFNSDPNHKWGLAPFHYEQNVYEEFIQKLNKI